MTTEGKALIDRLYRNDKNDTFEGFCQLVEEAKLTDFERQIIRAKLEGRSFLPEFGGRVLSDDPEDFKEYPLVYCCKKFYHGLKKNANNIILFVSNYENDEYVDDYVKAIELLKTGEKWELLDMFPEKKFTQLIKMTRNNFDHEDLRALAYEMYDDLNKVMFAHIDPQEYEICRKYKFLITLSNIYRIYFKINNIPRSQMDFYIDFEILVCQAQDYFINQDIADMISLRYHSSMFMTSANVRTRQQYADKVFSIQLRMFKKTKYHGSLYDILSVLNNRYKLKKGLDRVNNEKTIRFLVEENYDVFLKFKTWPINYCNWLNLIMGVSLILGGDLMERIQEDFGNELRLHTDMLVGTH